MAGRTVKAVPGIPMANGAATEPNEAGRVGATAARPAGRRAVRRERAGGRSARSWLRMVYFSIAAVWGFLVGTAAVLAGLAASGRPPATGPWMIGALAAAFGIAVAGGCCAALAYRQARGSKD